jgi:hypothetical protein
VLELRAVGARFTVSLDRNTTCSAEDRHFLKDGHVALWTEEDNVTRFDRIMITRLPVTKDY